MFDEDELLPISALQHYIFCPRQCALIHVERLWAENQLTVEGQHLHRRADQPSHETRGSLRIVRGLQLRSLKHGLIGVADVVEIASNATGKVVTPIEYKRGRPKKDASDRVQLCAQALCLEEIFETEIDNGFLFYGKNQRRTAVEFDERLRSETLQTIGSLRTMMQEQHSPLAVYSKKCDKCSLINLCLPKSCGSKRSASKFMNDHISRNLSQHS